MNLNEMSGTDGTVVVHRTVALFAGTFDPFTNGHKSIVDRSLKLFDGVVIAIGVHPDKRSMMLPEQRLKYISDVYADEPRVSVMCYEGLTTVLAREIGADVLVRGVRSVKDFEYERELADVNRSISGIETVLLMSEPQLASVSSSVVRELMNYGVDVSQFVPLKFEK
ncbi:MAG: pantetheine-phosphate adenylyltransferase [Bacteroidaceae bacterium]|nr:pantetheine-phosphate adenylyltransferase [Bacteroidaceae bacterium]